MKTIKYWLLGLTLLFASCGPTGPLYYGIAGFSEPHIEYVDGLYEVTYVVHVGKDANYYTVYYYIGDELMNGKTTRIAPSEAQYTVGYLEAFASAMPDTVDVIVTSYIGDVYQRSDTKTFRIIIPPHEE